MQPTPAPLRRQASHGRAVSVAGMRSVLMSSLMILVASVVGCGDKTPSYKDRVGTIDPATVPVDLPGSPDAPKR